MVETSVAFRWATHRLLKNRTEERRRDIFQPIADPSRKAMIRLTALEVMKPNAIADHFDRTGQAVSKHLL